MRLSMMFCRSGGGFVASGAIAEIVAGADGPQDASAASHILGRLGAAAAA